MNTDAINSTIEGYIDNKELSGASLLVQDAGGIVFRGKWGMSDIAAQKPLEYGSIFRLMSMTKCITAVAVMILCERGSVSLDAPVSDYIPEFACMQVTCDERYVFSPDKLSCLPLLLKDFSMDSVRSRPAGRVITVRDLLSHSSGLQQGLCGLLQMMKGTFDAATLREHALSFTGHVLDFEPGCGTGYSPVAGFDILGYIVETVSGMPLGEFIRREITEPLGMPDTVFKLNAGQAKRLVHVYRRSEDALEDVTGTPGDMQGVLRVSSIRVEHGCGGMYSTLDDYGRFASMLARDGVPVLKPETVRLICAEAPANHL